MDASSSKRGAGAGHQQKTEVRREVSDAGSFRVTSIGYSDGSTETLKEIKAGDDSARFLDPFDTNFRSDNGAGVFGKGITIDRIG